VEQIRVVDQSTRCLRWPNAYIDRTLQRPPGALWAAACERPGPWRVMAAAVLLAALASQGARADVLATEDLVNPTALSGQDRIRIVGLKVDPSKPVWVSYSLFALSAEADRKGEVVVEGSPEGVAVPIADSRVRFSAERMTVLRSSEKVASRLKKEAAGRSRDEMIATMGPQLYKAFEALMRNEGQGFAQTIVKSYRVSGDGDLVFSASLVKIDTLQPVLLRVAVGQGDIPGEYRDALGEVRGDSGRSEKILAAVISIALAVIYLIRKYRRRRGAVLLGREATAAQAGHAGPGGRPRPGRDSVQRTSRSSADAPVAAGLAMTAKPPPPTTPALRIKAAIACVRMVTPLGAEGARLNVRIDATGVLEGDGPIVRATGGLFAVFYAVDEGSHYTYVTNRDLEAVGIKLDDLHAIGMRNLAARINGEPGLQLERTGTFTGLAIGGDFEASLVLLDAVWAERLKGEVAGNFVVAVPTRDVCAYCDSRSREAIDALRMLAERLTAKGERLLCDRLLLRDGGRWRFYEGPAA